MVFLELHSLIKFPYLVLKNVKKDCIVFMLLLLVKIRNIVGSSANRADGHIVFGFCFVFCFHPMCCSVAVITACSAQFADVTLCVVSKLQMSRCQDVRRRKKSKVYDRRPGAVAAQDEIRKNWGEQSFFWLNIYMA